LWLEFVGCPPADGVGDGPLPLVAAREVGEETGWRPGQLQPLLIAQPTAGIMDAAHHIFVGADAVEVSAPADRFESRACFKSGLSGPA
jgi:8-oxo-dGTP pyrophosphatase MutT (NUDIX family)